MNKRTIKILAVILGALIVIAAAPALAPFIPSAPPPTLGLSPAALKDAAAFSISRPKTDTLTFNKKSGAWRINDAYDADTANVEALLKTLGEARISAVASRNLDNKASFGLDQDSATWLTLTLAGARKITFLIGKAGPLYSSFYLLKDKESVIYLVEGSAARTYLDYTLNDWRAKDKK